MPALTTTARTIALRLAWAAVVVAGEILLVQGLAAQFYIEGTSKALAEAARGQQVAVAGVAVLGAAALLRWRTLRSSRWVSIAVSSPVVLCWLPSLGWPAVGLIGVLAAAPVVVMGLVAGLLSGTARAGDRAPA